MSMQAVGPRHARTGRGRWLEANSAVWPERGIITTDQRQSILDFHDVAAAGLAGRRVFGRLVTILATLGAILTGVGVILFFASNWEEIPRYGKLAMILSGIAAVYLLAFWLKYQRGYERIGGALLFLGTFLYGAGVFLVAQVYNMPIDDPMLLGWWFMGVLPLGYLVRSRAMLFLAIVVGIGALGWKMTQWDMSPYTHLALYLTIGTGVYGLGLLQARSPKTVFHSQPYAVTGVLTAFVFTYLLSGNWFDESVERLGLVLPAGGWVIVWAGTGLSVAALGVAVLFRAATREERIHRLLEACGGVAFAGGALPVLFDPSSVSGQYVILYNGLLFGGAIWAIVLGLLGKKEWLVNTGVVFFGLGIATRYVDILWGMMDTSLFFMTGGVALLAAGFVLERARRNLINRARAQEVSNVA